MTNITYLIMKMSDSGHLVFYKDYKGHTSQYFVSQDIQRLKQQGFTLYTKSRECIKDPSGFMLFAEFQGTISKIESHFNILDEDFNVCYETFKCLMIQDENYIMCV